MGLFKKNPNETAYVGEKKHWTDVIKNTGDGNLLIWRQPEEDFNTNSTLIVMPGEEAIFIKGGVIQETFKKGTYQLSTQNYPFISRLRNAFSGGISTFNCVVYFVRKAQSIELKWGTSNPIQVRDRQHDIMTEVRASASYRVQVADPGMYLEKMVGNNVPFHTAEDLDLFFHDEFQGMILSILSNYLNSLESELIGLEAHLFELSNAIQPYINEALSEYGLSCVKFSLAGLNVDKTKYDRIDDYEIDLKIGEIKKAQGQKAAAQVLGRDYGTIKAVEMMTNVTLNPGAGGLAAAGAGMGMGMAAGGVMGAMMQKAFEPLSEENMGMQSAGQQNQQSAGIQFRQAGGQGISGRFTQQSAETAEEQQSAGQTSAQTNVQTDAQTPAGTEAAQNPMEALQTAKQLLDAGFMTQEEFERKRMEIISRL